MVRKAMNAALALLLGAATFYNLYLLASGRPFTGDEMTGVAESLDLSFAELAVRGPHMELNNAPLHYLLDRALLASAGFAPQLSWDLAVFFRLLPILWLSLFVAAVFLFGARELRSSGLPAPAALICALAAALFLALKPYLMSYALDDRPYSLWLLLSFLHLALFAEQYRRPRAGVFAAYATVATLLVLTAFVSVLQVLVAAAIFHLQKTREKKSGHYFLAAALCLVAGWFLWHVHVAEVAGGQKRAMLGVLLDIAMVAFQPWSPPYHVRNLYLIWQEAAFVEKAWCLAGLFLPLLLLGNRQLRALLLFVYGLLLCLLPITIALELKGQAVGGARYLMFLFPALFTLFLLSLFCLAHGIAFFLGRLRAPLPATRSALFTAFLLALAGQALHRQWIDFRVALHFDPHFLVQKAWGRTVPATCPQELGAQRTHKNGVDLAKVQELCGPEPAPKP